MTTIFINRFFYPDQSATSAMLTDLLGELDTATHEFVVIASASMHTPGNGEEPCNLEGVRVIRIPGLKKASSAIIPRLLDFALFYLGLIFVGGWTIKRGDTVVCLTDPPLVSVLVQMLTRLKGARLINWLQDIYPETATALGFGNARSIAMRSMKALRDRSWKKADMNVCIGSVMRNRVASHGVVPSRIRVVPNWANEIELAPLPVSANPLRQEWDLPEDSVIVGYSGNLGRAHDVDTMLDAGRQLVSSGESHLHFLFIGGGVKRDLLPDPATQPEIARHFHSRGYRPRSEMRQSLAVADIQWLSLEPELEGLIVPSKFYGAIAAGRPIIFIGDTDGEIARLITQAACGRSFAKGDVQGVADYIQ
ncbi:MAG: glycosyltransferase family 4 protein, partial [Alteraurantiacibacter sp.]